MSCIKASGARELEVHNRWMLLFSCVFVGASIFLTAYLGSIGFILANSLNMLVRALKR